MPLDGGGVECEDREMNETTRSFVSVKRTYLIVFVSAFVFRFENRWEIFKSPRDQCHQVLSTMKPI